MSTALLVIGGLAVVFSLVLGIAAQRLKPKGDPVARAIDHLLPQTQCGQCGYPGCRPYAEAIARGDADINQCPPGGESTIDALADLLGREPKPLNPENGTEAPPTVALIDESLCIGCKKCILVCPVDAIVGAPKLMHTVLMADCTGCDLCVPVCPVDCIDMVPAATGIAAWRRKPPKREPQAA
ncbi:MAG: electron transport complex subunit RsxB [Gammaproteobacteria bacterium]|nr:electron transport complex subunit RsxB [Gammaproteobacteria bacterium]